jgi:alkanesulfonate monooxygenase SsuD/methylene tetrahydromethanopterin reductase-like flavin-dependent oxidoreductase (luciferase family)
VPRSLQASLSFRTLACVLRPQLAPEVLAAAARTADGAGINELWLWEDCFAHGGIASAAIVLANSTNLSVGIGVLPVPLRNVALTAMEIATLDRAFPGRIRVGVGHGVQDWMGQVGAKVGSPLTLLREYIVCLRALLRGETLSFDGRYVSLVDVGLEWPPAADIPLFAAATGPKTLQLSGELAAGTILTSGTTPADVRGALGHIDTGIAARAEPANHSVVVNVICTTGPDAEQDAAAEAQRWDLGDAGPVSAHGSAAEIAWATRLWLDAGATTVVLQPPASVDIHAFLRFVGTEVQPYFAAHGHG